MKLKDLISSALSVKISLISFASPKKNLEIFKFIESITPHQKFRDIELDKLVKKYGEPLPDKPGIFRFTSQEAIDSYNKAIGELFDIDIDNIYPLNLTPDDFSDDVCTYPDDKSFWMNANDIDTILKFCSKLKDEFEIKKG